MSTAASVVEFLAALHGMDHIEGQGNTAGPAAADLLSGVVFRASSDFPDGEVLEADFGGGRVLQVNAHSVLEAHIVRTSEAYAITQGGSASAHYKHLSEHLVHKTGFGM